MAETKNVSDAGASSNGPVPQPGTVVSPSPAVSLPTAVQEVVTPITHPPVSAATPVPSQPVQFPAPPPPEQVAIPAPPPPQAQPLTESQLIQPSPPELAPPDQLLPPDQELTASNIVDDGEGLIWTASEFVAHNKSAAWYMLLAAATILIAVLVFILNRDKFSTGVIIIAGLLLGIYASHQPRQLEYEINQNGIGIGGKYHSYDEFKSFSVVPEGAFSSIVFMPLKRFGVPLTIYYAPNDEDTILDVLSDQLPFEAHHFDLIDSILKRIRF